MKPTLLPCLTPLAALLFAASSAADVTLKFDTDTEGFTQGANATAVEWSALHGGSLAPAFTPGWQPQGARLDLSSEENQALYDEWQAVLLNGGTLSFQIIIRSEDLVGGFPGWFEIILGIDGGDQLCCGTNAAGLPGLYGEGGFPAGQTQTFDVTLAIQPSSTNENDKILQVNPSAGSYVLQFGLNSEADKFESAIYFVDNLTIAANDGPLEVIIPSLSLEPATPGLNLIGNTPGEWSRQNVRTTTADYGWADAAGPVTYTFNIREFPEPRGYSAHMYLVPNPALAATATSPDWSEPVCIVATVGRHGDGAPGGYLRFAYKNDPANGGGGGSNGIAGHEYWTTDDGTNQGGTIAIAYSSVMTGEWKVTVANKKDVTLTTPEGQTASGSMTDDTAALFNAGMFVYFGAVPGVAVAPMTTNAGLNLIVDSLSITGIPSPLSIDFKKEAMDPGTLERAAVSAPGVVQIIEGETRYWLRWSPPTSGFRLYQNASLTTGEWADLLMTDVINRGEMEKWKPLTPESGVLEGNTNYFRLAMPE